MDKYGVVTEKKKDKLASKEETCPDCGQTLEKTANVPKCPDHGTKPFEKENDAEKEKE